MNPPSAGITAPVMHPGFSEAKKDAGAAISLGAPQRFILPRGFGSKRLMDFPIGWSRQRTALGLKDAT